MEKLIRQCQQGDRESMGQLYLAMRDDYWGNVVNMLPTALRPKTSSMTRSC